MKVNFCIVLLALLAVTHGRPQGATEEVTTEVSNVAPVPLAEDEVVVKEPSTTSTSAPVVTDAPTTATTTKTTVTNAPTTIATKKSTVSRARTTTTTTTTTTTKSTEANKDARNARRRAFLSRNGGSKRTNANELDTMINTMKRDGDKYDYKYDTRNGNTHEEGGRVVNKGTDNQMVVVRGGYKHTSDDGYTFDVKYIADERGFRPLILVHRPNE